MKDIHRGRTKQTQKTNKQYNKPSTKKPELTSVNSSNNPLYSKSTLLRIRGPIPTISNYVPFKNGIRLVMNEEAAALIQNSWTENKPLGLRVVKSDSNGIFRAIGFAFMEQAIFQEEMDNFIEK